MGQVIQQFRMRRPGTELAKIPRSAHDPLAKVMLPDPVDHDASGQRIGRTGDPARQLHPAAAPRNRRLVLTGKDAREAARHELAKPIITTANVDVHIMDSRLRTLGTAAFLNAVRVSDGPN